MVLVILIVGLVAGLLIFSRLFALWAKLRYAALGKIVSVSGAKINIVDLSEPEDDRIPVLLVHGASGTLRDQLYSVGQTLAQRHRVIVVDRPGQGHSQRTSRAMSRPVRQANAIAEALSVVGINRVIVVGHSWGGSVAAAFALNHRDRCAGLTFVSPVSHPWPGGISLRSRLGAVTFFGHVMALSIVIPAGLALLSCALRKVFNPNSVPRHYSERVGAVLALCPSSYVANCQDIADLHENIVRLSAHYDDIQCPVEIITGDEDNIIAPFIHSYGLARDIPGAHLMVLSGIGHMPHWSASRAVIAAVERTLDRATDEAPQTELGVMQQLDTHTASGAQVAEPASPVLATQNQMPV